MAPGVEWLAAGSPPDYSRDLERYLVRLLSEAGQRRQQILDQIARREDLVERQRQLRRAFWEMLGGPFEKSPLNPQTTGLVERPGYRIENVIYESRPKLFVTANLYVPAGAAGKRPAILVPLGHSMNGKAAHTYQKLCSNLARKGYVVLAFDPFGQGERIEYPGAQPGRSALGGGVGEHEHAGRRLILLGVNFSLYRAWDGIRGIDYLLSRPEVDPQRIGCCGQSGGGTMTQFLAALDERIRAAVVSQGNTENVAEGLAEPPGSVDDAEQNMVPSLERGIDRSDLLHAFAPKPLLVTVTTHDAGTTYSPEYISGTLEAMNELHRSWRLFGADERLSIAATSVRHGYVYEMRRATYGWFNRWLDNPTAGDQEPSQAVETDQTLMVTKTGFVATSLGGETALSLTRKLSAEVRPAAGGDIAERVRRLLALPAPGAPLMPRSLCRVRKPGYRAEQFEFTSELEIRTPGWLLEPDKVTPTTATVLYLSETGATNAVAEEAFGEQLCTAGGFRVCAIDVRGRGDCTPGYPWRGPRYFSYRNNENFINWFTLVLGRPLVGGQVFDVLRAAEYLRTRREVAADRIWVMGDGPHGVAALFAMALDGKLRGGVLRRVLTDYRSLATADRYSQPFGIYVYGILRQFDLPEVAAAIAGRPLLLLDPAAPGGQRAEGLYPKAKVEYSGDEAAALELIRGLVSAGG